MIIDANVACCGTPAVRSARRSWWRPAIPLLLSVCLSGCSLFDSAKLSLFGGGPSVGQPGYITGFLGEVVADEPRAALVGKDILSAGGNAADAAVAMGFSLAVTLPSRAGLGGGGVCVAYIPDRNGPGGGAPETINFTTPAARSVGGGDRPAGVPMLARGLFLLHARQGRLPMETLLGSAADLARVGVPVSHALASDLALIARPLFGDPTARAVFGTGGVPLAEGQRLMQPQLAATLAQMRISGVGDMYQGGLARRIQQESPTAGVPIGLADLWTALPQVSAPIVVPYGNDRVAFPPTEGGIGAAAAFISLKNQPADSQTAWARSIAAASRWRAGGVNSDQILNSDLSTTSGVPLYPASTTFAALDSLGDAVVCAVTMNNLFGTGRMLPGLGFLAAASPAAVTPPLLASGLAWSPSDHAFRAAAGGSGQAGAALAAASALLNTLRSVQPMPVAVPEPGRANVLSCAKYLPGSQSSCSAAADPREFGLATGGGN